MREGCEHEDDYGTTSMDGIRCFICNKQLNLEQSVLLQALDMRTRAQKKLEELRKPYKGGQVMSAIWRRRGMVYLLEDLLGISHEDLQE